MAVQPQITQAYDDVDPRSGAVLYGDYTNDASPLIHVALGDQAAAGDTLSVQEVAGAGGATLVLSADQVAQGFADLQLTGLAQGWRLLTAALSDANGVPIGSSAPAFALGVATDLPAAPAILGAIDDAGAVTGAVADGGHSDDASLTFRLYEAGLPPRPDTPPGHPPYGGSAIFGGEVQLFEGQALVGEARLGYDGEVTVTAGSLSAGDHVLTAVTVDRAGNVSAASAPFRVTIGPDAVPTPPPSGGPAGADDVLQATPGGEPLHGGAGNDTLIGTDGHDVLRGDAGADVLVGGAGFDDMNGNMGDDTLSGGAGGDWVVGGQGSDVLSGDAGDDIVYGNLGNDTCLGGDGADLIRGGQGDDVLAGGTGDDWLAGDRGDDTISGGAGADTFLVSGASGIDRILDFNAADGDRILLEPGATYHVDQVGADTVISVGGGAQVILTGVQMSSLGTGWLIAA